MFQMKQQDKNLNDTGVSNLSDKKFKAMILKTLTEIGRMSKHRENFNKEVKDIK